MRIGDSRCRAAFLSKRQQENGVTRVLRLSLI
jgi:hypothetical protein